jgi:predicted component of type VI protein secretion system
MHADNQHENLLKMMQIGECEIIPRGRNFGLTDDSGRGAIFVNTSAYRSGESSYKPTSGPLH